jgi:hypothetical protein
MQDHELISFAEQYEVNGINYVGDTQYLESVVGRHALSQYKMCVFVVNSLFDFDQVIATCNHEITNLPASGFLYLALNKFLAMPKSQDQLPDSYDSAIFQVITNGVNASLFKYYNCCIDGGQRFNWVHPITRFIFINENIN